jgi:hypothetical protein
MASADHRSHRSAYSNPIAGGHSLGRGARKSKAGTPCALSPPRPRTRESVARCAETLSVAPIRIDRPLSLHIPSRKLRRARVLLGYVSIGFMVGVHNYRLTPSGGRLPSRVKHGTPLISLYAREGRPANC